MKNKRFTLIELMVALLIFGVFVALTMPSVEDIKAYAKEDMLKREIKASEQNNILYPWDCAP